MSVQNTKQVFEKIDQPMNRRQVLKKLGFGSLAIAGSGSLVTMLQGCAVSSHGNAGSLLSASELASLSQVCEGILPRTQTPGAIDAGVPEHLSQALNISYRQWQADAFRRGLVAFADNYQRDIGSPLSDAGTAQVTARINSYLRQYENQPARLEALDRAVEQGRGISDDMIETYFVSNVIDATIWSYFTSELVGENVMRHDPVLGGWDACIDYNEGEHSWSS